MSKENKYPTKPKEYLDSTHYHEAADRAYIAVNFIERLLLDHTVFEEHKKLEKLVCQISDELADLHQAVSTLECLKEEEENLT